MESTISLITHKLLLVLINKILLYVRDDDRVLIFIFCAKSLLIFNLNSLFTRFDSCYLVTCEDFLFSVSIFWKSLTLGLCLRSLCLRICLRNWLSIIFFFLLLLLLLIIIIIPILTVEFCFDFRLYLRENVPPVSSHCTAVFIKQLG